MRVDGQSGTQSGGSNSAIMSSSDSDMFMKLLLTQLKTQDPMSPADPNEFVSQLVQFNTLGEITQIRQLVSSVTTTPDKQ